MTKPTAQLNQYLKDQIIDTFCQVLAETKDPQKIKQLLTELTSKKTFVDLAKRLAIAVYLDKNRSYENIKDNLLVEAATIAQVANNLGGPGIQQALVEVKAENWANYWTPRLAKIIKRVMPWI